MRSFGDPDWGALPSPTLDFPGGVGGGGEEAWKLPAPDAAARREPVGRVREVWGPVLKRPGH